MKMTFRTQSLLSEDNDPISLCDSWSFHSLVSLECVVLRDFCNCRTSKRTLAYWFWQECCLTWLILALCGLICKSHSQAIPVKTVEYVQKYTTFSIFFMRDFLWNLPKKATPMTTDDKREIFNGSIFYIFWVYWLLLFLFFFGLFVFFLFFVFVFFYYKYIWFNGWNSRSPGKGKYTYFKDLWV